MCHFWWPSFEWKIDQPLIFLIPLDFIFLGLVMGIGELLGGSSHGDLQRLGPMLIDFYLLFSLVVLCLRTTHCLSPTDWLSRGSLWSGRSPIWSRNAITNTKLLTFLATLCLWHGRSSSRTSSLTQEGGLNFLLVSGLATTLRQGSQVCCVLWLINNTYLASKWCLRTEHQFLLVGELIIPSPRYEREGERSK